MDLNLTETKSRITKTVTASAGDYQLTATATIENGKIVSMNGSVNTTTMTVDPMNISFDAYRSGDELKVNYHNIASDERDTLDIISAMVDAVVAKYEE